MHYFAVYTHEINKPPITYSKTERGKDCPSAFLSIHITASSPSTSDRSPFKVHMQLLDLPEGYCYMFYSDILLKPSPFPSSNTFSI